MNERSVFGFDRNTPRLVALLTISIVVMVACSSNAPKFTKEPILVRAAKATEKLGGTAAATVDLAGGHSTFTVQWKGGLLRGVGAVHGTLPGAHGQVPLDARWRGGQMYLKRSASEGDLGLTPLGQLMTVLPGQSLWMYGPTANATARVLAGLSPPDMVSALAVNGTTTTSKGPRVDGQATTQVVVEGNTGLLFNWIGAKHAELLVDSHDLVRRIAVSVGTERLAMDIKYSNVVPVVEAPAAFELKSNAPSPVVPNGPYRSVRGGSANHVEWAVQRAPGTDGATCWRWTSTPTLQVVKPNYLTDTRCFKAHPAGSDPVDLIDFVLTTDGSRSVAAVVATIPAGITQATLGFVGGRTQKATISGGLLTWVGPSAEPLGYVGFATKDGTINCGIGAVSSIGDLNNDQLVGNPFGSAWLCQA